MEQSKEPLVSIIVPSYNSEKFIGNTITSIVNQSYKNWELLIIDDCSKDGTVNIVKSFASGDSRIKLQINEVNVGAGKTRNHGIEKSVGRFVAFLDSDDQWLPHKLETQLHFMLDNSYPISFTSYGLIDEEGNDLNQVIRSVPEIDYRGVLKNTIIGMSTSMIDTNLVGRDFRLIDLRTRQDLYLWMSLLKQGHKAYGIDEVLVNYRVRPNSISSNKIKGAKRVWYLYYKVEKLGFFPSAYYFFFYIYNTIKKRLLARLN